ncbi:Hypothetical predicted protein [Olea europaea subsp. europaea]|uniref:Uncharacterized protein n=1 Tax=Olea europaea subsp. europaea TaxID=158383 RepID=A0A8S0TS65_OLEEU|nr:Hypothetical predicted protein [Olea europaea subsp. europaea]
MSTIMPVTPPQHHTHNTSPPTHTIDWRSDQRRDDFAAIVALKSPAAIECHDHITVAAPSPHRHPHETSPTPPTSMLHREASSVSYARLTVSTSERHCAAVLGGDQHDASLAITSLLPMLGRLST